MSTDEKKLKAFGHPDVKAVHFVGIAGAGMSALARIVISLGVMVSGSDLQKNPSTERLENLGARVELGHRADYVDHADLLVYSSAVRPDNPEISRALAGGVPVVHRSELLAGLMKLKRGVAVAGSHGKTSTAAMIAWILTEGGYRPALALGGDVIGLEHWKGWDEGPLLVAEADESDGSLERLRPDRVVLTGLDLDHVDYYSDWDSVVKTFRRFISRMPPTGKLIVNVDTPELDRLHDVAGEVVTYGLGAAAAFRATRIRLDREGGHFKVEKNGQELGEITLPQLGRCNVCNSLGAIALCMEEGVPFRTISRALAGFRGVRRRLEVKCAGPVMVIEDYAHHQVEIVAALKAIRTARPRRLWCVFQPHRYSRTSHFFRELAAALREADRIILSELYPAFEEPIPGVGSGLLLEELREQGRSDAVLLEQAAIRTLLLREVSEGDAGVIMGAGDIGRLAGDLAGAWSES